MGFEIGGTCHPTVRKFLSGEYPEKLNTTRPHPKAENRGTDSAFFRSSKLRATTLEETKCRSFAFDSPPPDVEHPLFHCQRAGCTNYRHSSGDLVIYRWRKRLWGLVRRERWRGSIGRQMRV